jgi:PPOX class probable F420-dependent enzyme
MSERPDGFIGYTAPMTIEVTAEIHGFSASGATPAPWAEGLELVRGAGTFWISTVRPDGRPHVTPLIAVWHDDAIWFTTGAEEVKGRNLERNPACALTTGRSELSGGFDVVLEGVAEQVGDEAQLEAVARAFAQKYGRGTWDFVVVDGAFRHRGRTARALVYRVRPARGLGFRKGDEFSQTSWRFVR